jgi:hypothetical protein
VTPELLIVQLEIGMVMMKLIKGFILLKMLGFIVLPGKLIHLFQIKVKILLFSSLLNINKNLTVAEDI